ncbi:MAG: hypothetical protein IKY65_05730 [Rikenellaceae bacterium]|nr:hypothetical protein [Rikenellaceae bacterium]
MKTFSIRRVAQYIAKHYAEYGRTYLLTYGVVIAILAAMALLHTVKDYVVVEIFYQMALRAMPILLLSITSISLRSLERSSHCAAIDLTLPMSSLERYLFLLVNTIVMGVLVQLAIIYCFDFWGDAPLLTMAKGYMIIHPIILVAYCWARSSKMAVAGLVWLWAGVMLLVTSISTSVGVISMNEYMIFGIPESYTFFDHSGADIRYNYDYDFVHPTWLKWSYSVVMYLLAYAIAYFKLRERRLA